MVFTDKRPPAQIILAAQEAARTCAMLGYDKSAVFTCYDGELNALSIGGKTYVHIFGDWFGVEDLNAK